MWDVIVLIPDHFYFVLHFENIIPTFGQLRYTVELQWLEHHWDHKN